MPNESPILRAIQLKASTMGGRLWRNTVGSFQDRKDQWINVGLCVGSHDLIGFLPLKLENISLPIFTAIEVKAGRTATTHLQKNFEQMVLTMHGVSAIVRSVNEFEIRAVQILDSLKEQALGKGSPKPSGLGRDGDST